MHLMVHPNLNEVVEAAQEAQVSIEDIQFIHNTDKDVLEALDIVIRGTRCAKKYFQFLLKKSKLTKIAPI